MVLTPLVYRETRGCFSRPDRRTLPSYAAAGAAEPSNRTVPAPAQD
ncbi:hypothetical protein AB0A73_27820 [Glycomyces sp. NPDC047369]